MKIKIVKDWHYKPSIGRKVLYPFVSVFYYAWLSLFGSKAKYNKKYDVVLCSIFKDEAPFLREWIEYHKMIGVQHIYLYNNNSTDNYKEVLETYIGENFVTLVEWPEVPGQMSSYVHWYNNYRNYTQWVSFLDIDEFICPTQNEDIRKWLHGYDLYPCVLMYWKFFGTSGLLEHNFNQLTIEQYYICYDGLVEPGKLFYNTSYPDVLWRTGCWHYMRVKLKGIAFPPVNEWKHFVLWGLSRIGGVSTIQVNHYWSKALDICVKKMGKGDVAFGGKSYVNYEKLLKNESRNTSSDYIIYRFLLKLKLIMKQFSRLN